MRRVILFSQKLHPKCLFRGNTCVAVMVLLFDALDVEKEESVQFSLVAPLM